MSDRTTKKSRYSSLSSFIYLLADAERWVRAGKLLALPSAAFLFLSPSVHDFPLGRKKILLNPPTRPRESKLSRDFSASSSRTRSGPLRSFPLIFRSEFHSSTVMAAAAAATAADRSRRGEEKKGKKNEDVQRERNSVPLVSKTRFSETIRHRIQERGGSERERAGDLGGNERKRGGERRSDRSAEGEYPEGPGWVSQGPWIFHPFACAPRIYVTDTSVRPRAVFATRMHNGRGRATRTACILHGRFASYRQ